MQTADNSNPTNSSQVSGSVQHAAEGGQGAEQQLKNLWSQYVNCLDKNGLNETAKELKRRYCQLYNSYRKNKYWREIVAPTKDI